MADSGARFTKYLTTILRLSYDNADRLTTDVESTKNLTKNARIFLGALHLQTRKTV